MNKTVSFIIFITIALAIYGALNAYFLYRHKNVISLKSLPKILFRLAATTLVLAPIATIIFSNSHVPLLAAATGLIGYGWLAFLFLFLVIHGLADIILFSVEKLGKTVPKHAARWVFGLSVGVNILILIFGAFDARNIQVEHLALKSEKLPPGSKPITIVQLSDIHFSSMTGKDAALRIAKLVAEIKPDIIVCTGDLVDRGIMEPGEIKETLERLPAPLGKFAIPGNHEYYFGIEKSETFIKEAGFTYLRDSATSVNGMINMVGIDDRTAKRFGQETGRSEKEVFDRIDQGLYTVVLKHQPLVEASSTPYFDLQLSGHTHAGQIFPFAVLVKLAFPYFSGLYEINDSTQIYVNRGTGTWGPPFRFLASPELTVITLEPALSSRPASKPVDSVKVAAVQCYSAMGSIEANRKKLEAYIRKAAEADAKIIVLPEAAITGYMEPNQDITWSKSPKPGQGEMTLVGVAEPIPGPSTNYFSRLAKELNVYLTIPLIESSEGKYYNSMCLAGPTGKLIAHHRKQSLWLPGDSGWCTPGDRPPQIVETPYGRLGLMICYDWNSVPEKLAKESVDIVLYSVGWFGPNTKDWYRYTFPKRVIIPHDFHVIAANWSGGRDIGNWEGQGFSSILSRDGKLINMAETTGPSILYGKIPVSSP